MMTDHATLSDRRDILWNCAYHCTTLVPLLASTGSHISSLERTEFALGSHLTAPYKRLVQKASLLDARTTPCGSSTLSSFSVTSSELLSVFEGKTLSRSDFKCHSLLISFSLITIWVHDHKEPTSWCHELDSTQNLISFIFSYWNIFLGFTVNDKLAFTIIIWNFFW